MSGVTAGGPFLSDTFEAYRWHALRKRREFFFFYTNVLLTLVWAAIHYDGPAAEQENGVYHNAAATVVPPGDDNFYVVGSGSNSSGSSANVASPAPPAPRSWHPFAVLVLYGLAAFFYYLHGAVTLGILLSGAFRDVLHDTQGRKFVNASVLSLVVADFYVLLPLLSGQSGTSLDSTSRMAVFALVSAVALATAHHFGVSHAVAGAAFALVGVLWAVYMCVLPVFTPPVVIAVVIAVFMLGLTSRVQETELRRAYDRVQQQQPHKPSLAAAAHTLSALEEDVVRGPGTGRVTPRLPLLIA